MGGIKTGVLDLIIGPTVNKRDECIHILFHRNPVMIEVMSLREATRKDLMEKSRESYLRKQFTTGWR